MPRRPKRTRWTVTFEDGSKEVALSYDGSDLPAWYLRRLGKRAVSVTKGDYRALPPTVSGAKPFRDNVAKAVAFLGIERKVSIELSGRAAHKRGHHLCLPEHPLLTRTAKGYFHTRLVPAEHAVWVHHIVVNSRLDAAEMGRTLWHELAHAMQFERDCSLQGTVQDVFDRSRKLYNDGTAYADKPWEVEADSYMEHNDEIPLAR